MRIHKRVKIKLKRNDTRNPSNPPASAQAQIKLTLDKGKIHSSNNLSAPANSVLEKVIP